MVHIRMSQGNKAMLLSADGLDVKKYNEESKEVTWETCTLRKWLNEEFFDTAFSAEEQQRIISMIVKNPDNPNYQTPGGNDTEDKVFLLSIDEALKYLVRPERIVAPSPYVKKKGYLTWNGYCCWWLRSPGCSPDCAAGVSTDGIVDNRGGSVKLIPEVVRPALWVELGSDI